ncbi:MULTISPECIES: LacI family DNA-binding transcriptional regulator [Micromonospora]|uniref:Transcriptional regulator n=1 Tax=Micromonospora maris TaxID=1003110 RepID=A0A9X0I0D3_9ACTN|nr:MULTISPECIES: LacI family DNA-binding transcriptional regulator [Micromonospora]AEB44986.1 transcriptional regulator [Micromonospora maris AB-18-032]KUJ44434.1 transcriptional regulator [Micromonospora maris]RUL92280.1 LacI family DNA-binding transcriptional regulator [Verrucosispora sp. FIM060022]
MGRDRATLADVAKRAGLSKTAASMVLNGREGTRLSAEAHQRVFAAAEELGYRPNVAARSLRTRKTATIAFVSDIVATTRFAGGLIRGALDAARERDHVLLITETQGDATFERYAIEAILDRQVDGVIYAAMATRRLSVPPAILSGPVVLLNATSAEELPCVLPDDEGAGVAIAETLLGYGHRDRIALIGRNRQKERDPEISLAAEARLRGIRATLAAAGVSLLVESFCPEWLPEHGYTATRALLARPDRPTAIICMNDRLAFGAYQALGEAGLTIPDDISVISFDDDPTASWLRPRLSTAALPHEQMGRRAVELLLDGEAPAQSLVPMPLRRRRSVAAPAGAPAVEHD